MKKTLFFSLFLITLGTYAQSKHEVKWNIANTIAFASAEIGYEYLFDENQSVGAELLINDTYNLSIGRQVKDFNTNSFQLTYSYYVNGHNSSFVISPMLKFRTGDYQKTASDPKIDMDSFILGIQMGYKWILNDKFTFGPYGSIGRNFSDKVNDEFDTAVEFHAGFGIGYRF
ncbi:DUF3575 domain-containing protein [Flavobacterium silvaticum]|uniref:DUF3575 domain-containing protein n=1 Tax=Flavobacterium silvaticum TaxID=1852020 RepID=A0A972FS97_9FLAO|nr:DUF3575 domain-containing protein [Flavobacterium silvaticum]NMH26600.1 DUF3575 domain-containing protein [Flavobacterium silvaticum]